MKNAILLFFIGIQFCIAQPKPMGETEKALETSKTLLEKLQFDSAYVYADKALWLANQAKDKKLQIQANLSVAEALYKQGKKVNGIPFAEKALQYAKETNDNEAIMKSWLQLGNIYHSQFEDGKAISFYRQIDALAAQHKIENATLVKSITATGLLFLRGYEEGSKPPMERAEAYFRRAYQTAIKSNAKTEAYVATRHLGETLISRKEPDYKQAIALYTEGYNYFKSAGDRQELASTNLGFAGLYRQMGRNDIAEKFYRENITINNIPDNITGSAHAHWQYAAFFYTTRQYAKAIPVYETAIRLFRMQQNPEIGPMNTCTFEVSECFAKTGNLKRAYDYLRLNKTYRDSLDIRQDKSDFTEIEGKFQAQKKETETKLLSAQKEIAFQQRINYLCLFFGIMALVAMTLAIVRNKNKNKIRNVEKLREINALKSKFFATISQEFRTPLALVKNPLQNLQASAIDSVQKNQLAIIDKNADRMLELVDQLLELSKIDGGQFKLVLRQGKLDDFLHSAIEPFVFQARENGINFISNIEKTPEEVYFDKEVIQKITTYLLSNAFKYTLEKQPVYFSGTIENRQLHLRISNGSDLTKEELPQLFDRFYKKNDNQNGSGIGLALVKDLVELYGGTIDAAMENNTLRFLIKLPLDNRHTNVIPMHANQQPPVAEIPVAETPKPENKELPILLIVDDNPETRRVLGELFAAGYKILEASDGDKALKVARKEIPDCIISDIMMPKMSGLAFTHAIKNDTLTSFVPLVLLTAKTSNETHLEALKGTADAFLTKPINHKLLKTTVDQLVAERRQLQEHYSKELVLKPADIAINPVDGKFLDKLQEVLDNELSNPDFSTDEFASRIGMNRMQLHRKLKTLIGVSATEFLRNERLRAAAELLRKGGDASEIAYTVGFNDMSYFSKCFRERYHATPSEYAKA